MKYLRSPEEAEADESLLAYVRIIQCAWLDFGLTGVLCVDNIPAVYIKEVPEPLHNEELNGLHLSFWNQGVAQTLLVADPKTVRIFSGLAKPQKRETPLTPDSPSLVDTLTFIEFAQQAASFCQATANGSWYIKHSQKYRSDSSVDAYLLDNLVGLHNDLSMSDVKALRLETLVANALIGRILFVCYLVDRGIVVLPEQFAGQKLHEALKQLQDDNKAITFLYNLFGKLKDDFNGSMFDQDLSRERNLVKPFHMQQIRHFLDGQKVGLTQHNLGFWAYDFKLIPVETISAIYEEFLAHEDPEGKRETGAFYTPRFLAEMTIDVAVEGQSDWHTRRYLDPCCGSGIFLVTLFNRIATKWFLDNPGCVDYLTKANALKAILNHNIRGVDLNPTACRLACFSLYIAFLDYLSPSDINTYVINTRHKLPYLLAGTETASGKECVPVVRCADFLHDSGLEEESFDCVIGNPPWEGRSSKLIAIHILEHAERYIVAGGKGCLLLPSKVFLNAQTNSFQAQWLKRATVERVIQLADYRFILFEQAICPAMIVRYRKQTLTDSSHRVAYDTPKFHPSARRRGLVTIGSLDHKWLSQTQVVNSAKQNLANTMWKRIFWGTERDLRLITYLETLPSLSLITGLPGSNARWSRGKGFEPDTNSRSSSPHVPWWNEGALYLSSRSESFKSGAILFKDDCEIVGDRFKALRRPAMKTDQLTVIINYGFGNVSFVEFEFVFRNSIHFISGPKNDENLLLFLTVYLRSNLAKYLMFHTAANWGTERDKVHLEELLTLPFPLPEDAPSENAATIVSQVADRMRQERSEQESLYKECLERHHNLAGLDEQSARKEWLKLRKQRTEAIQLELEPLIYEYFGLLGPEVMLLEDTVNISIPSSTPSKGEADSLNLPTLQTVSSGRVHGYENGLAVYANTLADTLNSWAKERGSDFRVKAAGGVDKPAGVAMVTLQLGDETGPMIDLDIKDTLAQRLKSGLEACSRQTGTIMSEREMLWFEGERIHIIRPSTLVHWTRTAALNDADTIYGEIAVARRQIDA